MKLDVFGCELDIDGKMRGAVSFHDNNTYVSFTADDGSSVSIIEDGTIPHDASTSLSDIVVTRKRARGFDVYDVVATTKRNGTIIRETQLLDGKGHKIVFSGPIAPDWERVVANCEE
jgi:hypothetical protein